MSKDRTQSLDPLGDATRARAEVRITGAQLMDIIDEREALREALRALVEADEKFAGDDPDGWCDELEAARALLDSAHLGEHQETQ